jgi:hypothetical protein
MYYITIYFTFILTFTKSWLPPINNLIDFPEDGILVQSMLKDINLKTAHQPTQTTYNIITKL